MAPTADVYARPPPILTRPNMEFAVSDKSHPQTDGNTATAAHPVLVIGSPATAQDGKYQILVQDLEASQRVERQMVDRLLDGGECIWALFPLTLRL